jgi:glycine reductase
MQPMTLERATYTAADVVAGPRTAWSAGTLAVDIAGIAAELRREPGIRDAVVRITRPHESIRIVDALDIVAPVNKPSGSTFPGLLDPVERCGSGRTDLIDGVAVMATARLDSDPEQVPTVVDLAGPGAAATPWAETFNVVLSFLPDPAVDIDIAERAIRLSTIRVARDLARTVEGIEPDRIDALSRPEPVNDLPGVCAVIAVASEGVGQNTYLYGAPFHAPARLIDPLEILDGALVCGAYTQPGTRQPTYFYQRSELLQRLLALHGSELRFCGVVLTEAYLDDVEEKERAATGAASVIVDSGAQGAVLTTYGGGNSHTDVMLLCRAAERSGVRTSILLAETNAGLTDHVAEADCIVSVGNEDELLPEWRPDRVLGGETFADGRAAMHAGPLSYLAYLGSVTQTGDRRLQAGSA